MSPSAIVSSGVMNALTFRHVRVAQNYDYGLYLSNTQVDRAQGILFDMFNSEYLAQSKFVMSEICPRLGNARIYPVSDC